MCVCVCVCRKKSKKQEEREDDYDSLCVCGLLLHMIYMKIICRRLWTNLHQLWGGDDDKQGLFDEYICSTICPRMSSKLSVFVLEIG